MTKEELLAPRYKVIADYPGGYDIDTILYVDERGELYCKIAGYHSTVVRILQKEVGKYKAIVQPLEWWMDRKPEDLPQYIQYVRDGKKMAAYKIHGWNIEKGYAICERGEDYPLWLQKHTIPITDTEYEAYQATLKQQ